MVNLYVCMYTFVCMANSSLANWLWELSLLCRENHGLKHHICTHSSFLVFFKIMILHTVIMIWCLLNVRHSARTLHLTPLILPGLKCLHYEVDTIDPCYRQRKCSTEIGRSQSCGGGASTWTRRMRSRLGPFHTTALHAAQRGRGVTGQKHYRDDMLWKAMVWVDKNVHWIYNLEKIS